MEMLNKLLLIFFASLTIGIAFAEEGTPAPLPQEAETPQVLQPAENSDNPATLYALAVKYEHAEGMPRDLNKAVDLYCRAAKSGNPEAQYALGWMYANGRGVTRSDDIAAQLFTMASEQGHAHAKEMLRYTHAASSPSPLPACLLPDPIVTAESTETKPEESTTSAKPPVYQKGPVFDLVHKLAPVYEIDPGLALAVISVESGFNINAKSPKNAQGLMQLIPETAQRFKVKNAFDAAENIKGGLAYLQWLLAFFKGDVSLVAAAYNAGEGAVKKYRGIPPYPETKDYVKKITRLYSKTTHPYKTNLVKTVAF